MALGDQQHPCDVIIIGRGAAAADYLLSLPRRYQSLQDEEPVPMAVLVIGELDPWAGGRGYVPGAYAQYVNQEKAVLQRRTGKTAPSEQGPQDRLAFAQETEAIIRQYADRVVDGTVRRVSIVPPTSHTERRVFLVDSSAGRFYGHRIVFATGAGIEGDRGHADYHMVPEEVKSAWPKGPPAGVMDLDGFVKLSANGSLAGKKVAVLGPTAGTDAVMTALTLRVPPANLYWLMRGKASTVGFANVYPGATPSEQGVMKQAMKTAEQNIVAYEPNTLTLAGGSAGRIRLRCSQVNAATRDPLMGKPVAKALLDFEVDYFVYSIGQPAANTLTAPPVDPKAAARKILDADLINRLEPVYDVNQRQGSAPWEHVTAVQLEGSDSQDGLLIIGAAAFQVSGRLEHNFLQYEFDQLRTALSWWTAFNACAAAHFPELAEDRKLSQMLSPSVEVCLAREKAFRVALRMRIDQQMQKVRHLPSDGMTARSDRMFKQAMHLCYLFQQRRKAAQYLFGGSAAQNTDRSVQRLLNPTRTLPATLADCRLLAAVNANVSALNASAPRHLAEKTIVDPLGVGQIHANFLEDETELRCYIAQNYPNIQEPSAQWFIRKVVAERKLLGNRSFPKDKIFEFEMRLQRMDYDTKRAPGL
jgi:hypothetical protein